MTQSVQSSSPDAILREGLIRWKSPMPKMSAAPGAAPSDTSHGTAHGAHDAPHEPAHGDFTVPPRPPTGDNGKGSGGGFGRFFGGQGKERKMSPLIGLILLACAWVGFMELQDMYSNRMTKREQSAKIENLHVEKEVAELKKSLAEVPPATPVKRALSYASTLSCVTQEESLQGFNHAETQVFDSDVKFVSGCAAAKFTFDVTSIEGKDFVIEFPDKNNPGKVLHRCNTQEKCIDFVNYLRDGKEGEPRFWVVVKDGGHVTLRR